MNNKLFSHNVRWLIQIPRLYEVYKSNGSIRTFEDIVTSVYKFLIVRDGSTQSQLIDVFQPLFEVTENPGSHPELHIFLQRVVGFDTVDDESRAERRIHKKFPYPQFWDLPQSPPYSYWYAFYTYSKNQQLIIIQVVLYVRQYGKSQ